MIEQISLISNHKSHRDRSTLRTEPGEISRLVKRKPRLTLSGHAVMPDLGPPRACCFQLLRISTIIVIYDHEYSHDFSHDDDYD